MRSFFHTSLCARGHGNKYKKNLEIDKIIKICHNKTVLYRRIR